MQNALEMSCKVALWVLGSDFCSLPPSSECAENSMGHSNIWISIFVFLPKGWRAQTGYRESRIARDSMPHLELYCNGSKTPYIFNKPNSWIFVCHVYERARPCINKKQIKCVLNIEKFLKNLRKCSQDTSNICNWISNRRIIYSWSLAWKWYRQTSLKNIPSKILPLSDSPHQKQQMPSFYFFFSNEFNYKQ